jgi:hypothetical protein
VAHPDREWRQQFGAAVQRRSAKSARDAEFFDIYKRTAGLERIATGPADYTALEAAYTAAAAVSSGSSAQQQQQRVRRRSSTATATGTAASTAAGVGTASVSAAEQEAAADDASLARESSQRRPQSGLARALYARRVLQSSAVPMALIEREHEASHTCSYYM